MNPALGEHRTILQRIAQQAMTERGLRIDFPPEALAESERIRSAPPALNGAVRDLQQLAWSSIDNEESRDLDQLTVAIKLRSSRVKILVAVADVDALVGSGSEIDLHAQHNTTSVYTPAQIFHMLPETLSTDLTSLNFREQRLALVTEMVVSADGAIVQWDIYRARVVNHARLNYSDVAAWFAGDAPAPQAAEKVPRLLDNLRLQAEAAERLNRFRHRRGALTFDIPQTRPVFDGTRILRIDTVRQNKAQALVSELMLAANTATAAYLEERNLPSLRRVVRAPKRWDRIRTIAAEHGHELPDAPDPQALERFLTARQATDGEKFADLSMSVIKLIGGGEYVADLPGNPAPGHFGLAVKDYTHSTAPNRRYSDLITHRLIKAALTGATAPYSPDELTELARHCTRQEDEANKVERRVNKAAAALLLAQRIGESFPAIVTGAAPKGTWIKLTAIPVEGRLVEGSNGVDVGDRLTVRLSRADIEQGHLDFCRNA